MHTIDLLADPPASMSASRRSSPPPAASADTPRHRWAGVLDSAIDAVGHTPLIRLGRFAAAEGVRCNILAKTEFFSAGGSIKDRIAKRMIEKAEQDGRLIPGKSTIIEPTSGNTGIGLAMISAIKGYRCIITMPRKMSMEKEALLRSLGAEVVRTPDAAPWDSDESHISVAKRLEREIMGGVILDQYKNEHNPGAHYDGTFEEIQHSLDTSNLARKRIDVLVSAAGTGGTVTGLSRALADHTARREAEAQRAAKSVDGLASKLQGTSISSGSGDRKPIVVAVDPVGSILGGGTVGHYQVEGIGYDFFPAVLDPSEKCINKWIKTTDDDAFEMNRRLIRSEGLLIGGSSGSALAGMLKYLRETSDGQRIAQDRTANVVVILADGIRNYISKPWFLDGALRGEQSELSKEIEEVLGAGPKRE